MIQPANPDKPPLEPARRSKIVDMSAEAIARRLRETFDLWEFWQFLKKFRPVQPANQRPPTSDERPS